MNKVTTINLNGRAFQIDEAGFDALRKYLDEAHAALAENPDKDEIMADFEAAIADKCDAQLHPGKNVVTALEIESIIKKMGPVEGGHAQHADHANGHTNGSATGTGTNAGASTHYASAPPKRLYQIRQGAWITGVCNGLAAYFNTDVTFIRVLFVVLAAVTHGFGIALYIILMIVIPTARTEDEFAAAHGTKPFNAHDFIEQAKARYSDWDKEFNPHNPLNKNYKPPADGTATGATAAAADTASATEKTNANWPPMPPRPPRPAASASREEWSKWKDEMKGWKDEMKAWHKAHKKDIKNWQKQWHDTRRESARARHQSWNSNREDWADRYRDNAQWAWHNSPVVNAGMGFFRFVMGLIIAAIFIAFVLGVVSIAHHQGVPGIATNTALPIWIPIVFLAALCYLLILPFKLLMKNARPWPWRRYSFFNDLVQSLVFLFAIYIVIYLGREIFPAVNDLYLMIASWPHMSWMLR